MRKGHLVSVTRDDLVGQYIGQHRAEDQGDPEARLWAACCSSTRRITCIAPENERDYGQEAIEILLQVMENQREDIVVILAGYADRMDRFYATNPGFRSRIAHHIEFPDYDEVELLGIAEAMLAKQAYLLSPSGRAAFATYVAARRKLPHFANARSIRNALDRAKLRPGQPAGGRRHARRRDRR